MITIVKKASEYVKNGSMRFWYELKFETPEEKDSYVAQSKGNSPETKVMYNTGIPCAAGTILHKKQDGTYTTHQDNLEQVALDRAAGIETFTQQFLGKLRAVGISPSVYKARMLAEA